MDWSGVTAVITLGLLITTAIYAWLTHRMAKSMEIQAFEMARPRISVSLATNQGGQMLLLRVANLGQTAAENLELRIDRPVHQQWGSKRNLQEFPAFQHALPALAPGSHMSFSLGVHTYLGDDVDREKHPLSFVIAASYSRASQKFEETFPIDIRTQLYQSAMEKDYLDEFGRQFPDKFDREIRSLTRAVERVAYALEADADQGGQ